MRSWLTSMPRGTGSESGWRRVWLMAGTSGTGHKRGAGYKRGTAGNRGHALMGEEVPSPSGPRKATRGAARRPAFDATNVNSAAGLCAAAAAPTTRFLPSKTGRDGEMR